MTKDEIDKLFEYISVEKIEKLFDFINNEDLKNKIQNSENPEEMIQENLEEIVEDINSNIPTELWDYFCDKAINQQCSDLIVDEKIREEQLEKFEQKVNDIIKMSDDEKIASLDEIQPYNYRMQIVMSLGDIAKVRALDKFDSLQHRVEIAKTIENPEQKLNALDKIEDEYYKQEVAKTINDSEVKLRALDKFEDEDSKVSVAMTIEDAEVKLKALDKINSPASKGKLAITINDSEVKLRALDKIDDPYYKKSVAITIKDSEVKLRALDKFEDEDRKMSVAMTIEDSEVKFKALDKMENPEDMMGLAKTIKDPIYRLKSTEKFTESESYRKEIIDTFTLDELEILCESKELENIDIIKTLNNRKKVMQVVQDESNKQSNESNIMGLPKDMTIGVELESEGGISKDIIGYEMLERWKGVKDGSLHNGVEINSPILHDNEEDMKELEIVCHSMQRIGLEATENCGGHIHIGADYLQNNPQALENLMTIWNECEELFYKMSNEEGIIPRNGIVKYAKTRHSKIEESSIDGKLSIRSTKDFEDLRSKIIKSEPKYSGLNLGHYGEMGKNTIEFRMPNGTLNPETIRANIKLFGTLMQVSKEMALNPEYKKEEFARMTDRNLTEAEKVEALLDLLFDDEKTKSVYRGRWTSVRDEEIFDELTEGGVPTFKRGNYEIVGKDNIEGVANSQEAIQEMSDIAPEIRKVIEERSNAELSNDNNEEQDNNEPR